MTRNRDWLGLALSCVLVGWLPTHAAAAQDSNNFQIDFGAVGYAAAIGVVALPFFGTAEVAYAAHGRWLPPAWAVGQLAIAGTSWSIMAEFALRRGVPASAMISTALAAWFVTDSVLSLALFEPERALHEPPRTRQLAASIVPTIGGAEGMLMGRF